MSKSDETVMYILVNCDIKMGKGKLAAQVAHAACKASHRCMKGNIDLWNSWFNEYHTKIVLRSDEKTMKELMETYPDMCVYVHDAGRTQIDEGTLTTVAFYPIIKKDRPNELRYMKLL